MRSQSEDLDGNLSSGTSSAHSVQRGRSASPLHGMSSRTMYLCPVIAWAGSWASASYACTTESSTTWRPAGSVSSCSSAITHFVMGPRLAQRQPLPTIASAEGSAIGQPGPAIVPLMLMGLPLVPMTVSWPADTKLFVRGTTATRKGHSAQNDAGSSFSRAREGGVQRSEPSSQRGRARFGSPSSPGSGWKKPGPSG